MFWVEIKSLTSMRFVATFQRTELGRLHSWSSTVIVYRRNDIKAQICVCLIAVGRFKPHLWQAYFGTSCFCYYNTNFNVQRFCFFLHTYGLLIYICTWRETKECPKVGWLCFLYHISIQYIHILGEGNLIFCYAGSWENYIGLDSWQNDNNNEIINNNKIISFRIDTSKNENFDDQVTYETDCISVPRHSAISSAQNFCFLCFTVT